MRTRKRVALSGYSACLPVGCLNGWLAGWLGLVAWLVSVEALYRSILPNRGAFNVCKPYSQRRLGEPQPQRRPSRYDDRTRAQANECSIIIVLDLLDAFTSIRRHNNIMSPANDDEDDDDDDVSC